VLILKLLEAIKNDSYDEDAPSAKYVGEEFLVHRLSTGFPAILEFTADEERVLLTGKVEDISISSGSVIVYTKNTSYCFEIKGE
jgi:hypothetical protein